MNIENEENKGSTRCGGSHVYHPDTFSKTIFIPVFNGAGLLQFPPSA
jgi:hypothetical protein